MDRGPWRTLDSGLVDLSCAYGKALMCGGLVQHQMSDIPVVLLIFLEIENCFQDRCFWASRISLSAAGADHKQDVSEILADSPRQVFEFQQGYGAMGDFGQAYGSLGIEGQP